MNILGIETSCDETAAAVVTDGRRILSNVVASQADLHARYGGVVPEVAARSHIEQMLPVVQQSLNDARLTWKDIDGIAVTAGPGLLGSLLIGTLTARTLAETQNKPLYGVNHVEAHVYANLLEPISSHPEGKPEGSSPWNPPQFPILALIVSGGHSLLALFSGHHDYRVLGQTRDDAAGEAFDKVAKLLGLGYPGGPAIAKAAELGDPLAYTFPVAKLDNAYDFSFSGLKTAVLRHVQHLAGKDFSAPSQGLSELLTAKQINDTAASFQQNIVSTMVEKTVKAYGEFNPQSAVIAGGVAANQELRRQLKEKLPIAIEYAPMNLCTDNAAMIAALGFHCARSGRAVDPQDLKANPVMAM